MQNVDKDEWKKQVLRQIEDLVMTLESEAPRSPGATVVAMRARELVKLVGVV